MAKKYLIILDVDNTLIDTNYKSTSPTIYSTIEQMKNEGHVFLINSNRSIEDLKHIAKKFGLEKHIIGENGCFIYSQLTGEEKILVEDEVMIQLSQVKTLLPQLIKSNFPDAVYKIGDTTDINKHLESQDIPEEGKNIFILNQYRRFSISLHAKKVVDGELRKDLVAVEKISKLVQEFVDRQQFDLTVTYTDSYGNLLVFPRDNDKGKAFNSIAKEYPKFIRVVIGDDYLDKPLMSEVDYFLTVNNATEEVKQMADYTSSESITKGVEQILLNLDNIIKK
jgi:HAD superfamily hydrolase (TIGR01484 family)